MISPGRKGRSRSFLGSSGSSDMRVEVRYGEMQFMLEFHRRPTLDDFWSAVAPHMSVSRDLLVLRIAGPRSSSFSSAIFDNKDWVRALEECKSSVGSVTFVRAHLSDLLTDVPTPEPSAQYRESSNSFNSARSLYFPSRSDQPSELHRTLGDFAYGHSFSPDPTLTSTSPASSSSSSSSSSCSSSSSSSSPSSLVSTSTPPSPSLLAPPPQSYPGVSPLRRPPSRNDDTGKPEAQEPLYPNQELPISQEVISFLKEIASSQSEQSQRHASLVEVLRLWFTHFCQANPIPAPASPSAAPSAPVPAADSAVVDSLRDEVQEIKRELRERQASEQAASDTRGQLHQVERERATLQSQLAERELLIARLEAEKTQRTFEHNVLTQLESLRHCSDGLSNLTLKVQNLEESSVLQSATIASLSSSSSSPSSSSSSAVLSLPPSFLEETQKQNAKFDSEITNLQKSVLLMRNELDSSHRMMSQLQQEVAQLKEKLARHKTRSKESQASWLQQREVLVQAAEAEKAVLRSLCQEQSERIKELKERLLLTRPPPPPEDFPAFLFGQTPAPSHTPLRHTLHEASSTLQEPNPDLPHPPIEHTHSSSSSTTTPTTTTTSSSSSSTTTTTTSPSPSPSSGTQPIAQEVGDQVPTNLPPSPPRSPSPPLYTSSSPPPAYSSPELVPPTTTTPAVIPPPTTPTIEVPPIGVPPPEPTASSPTLAELREIYAEANEMLLQMGFENEEENLRALFLHEGDIGSALNSLSFS